MATEGETPRAGAPRPRRAADETTPLISVVLPVYGVEPYLAQCLDSILAETDGDLEVIAVNDCSPDGCGGILDQYAARDDRLRVVHLRDNVGLGRAREAGLEHANGTYVWFVDSDDWLPAGAIAAVRRELTATRPDVLLVDFALAFDNGVLRRDTWERIFHEAPRGVPFTLADQPRLLQLIMTAWNKVTRREFLDGLGVGFGHGYYEDISVTYPLLLAAQRIAVLDEVCYYYRRGRLGAITGTTSDKHFDLFAQYERIFAFIQDHPGTERFARAVFDRTVKHVTTVYGTPGLVPAASRRRFFHTMASHFARFRPAGYRYPRGLRGVQYRLVERDDYRAYGAFAALAGVRLRARASLTGPVKALRRLRRRAALAPRLAWYELHRRLPIDDRLAVYAAYWYRGYAGNPRAIYETARELAPHVHGVWVVRRDAVATLPEGVDHVVEGSPRYLRVMARARYLVNNVNFPHELAKRPGSVHVQTQHGTPLKTLGLDLREHPIAAQDMNFARLLEHCGRWDYLVSPNPHSTEVWTRVYPGHYEVLQTGYPRNDRLVNAGDDEVARLRADFSGRHGLSAEASWVLYAPTFRDGPSGPAALLDVADLARALGPGHVLLVRAHYFDDGLGALDLGETAARVLDVSSHDSIEELCLIADVLVTDYSSLMFDYACLDRPIVIYAPDWDDYQRVRGVYFDLLAEPPGAVATDQAGLAAVFERGEHTGERAKEARARFRARFCALEDGHAGERVVRRVFLGEPAAAVSAVRAADPADATAG